jgi:hypothetical protein
MCKKLAVKPLDKINVSESKPAVTDAGQRPLSDSVRAGVPGVSE